MSNISDAGVACKGDTDRRGEGRGGEGKGRGIEGKDKGWGRSGAERSEVK